MDACLQGNNIKVNQPMHLTIADMDVFFVHPADSKQSGPIKCLIQALKSVLKGLTKSLALFITDL